jgi:hypothetical protein
MTYCYHCPECGNDMEVHCALAQFTPKRTCPVCGFGDMGIDLVGQHQKTVNRPGKWPMESDAAGVAVDQVDECAAYVRERGVPTEFNPKTGNPIFTSQRHRKRFCEVTNLYDRNAGFGDATPKHNMQKARAKCRR